jgi:hypothetical protein
MKRAKMPQKKMKFRQSLFWDVDSKTIDPTKHAYYIVERILDFGTDDEVRWMARTYPRSLIRKVTETSRVLDPKSKSLWMLVYA